MDWADRVVQSQGRESHRRMDPLSGMDIAKEYTLIKSGKSKLHERIKGMVVARIEMNV